MGICPHCANLSFRVEQIQKEIEKLIIMGNSQSDLVQAAFAKVEANFVLLQTAFTNVTTGIAALDAKIIALAQQLAAGGTLSQTDQDALTQLVTDSAALVTQAQGISTTDPSTPIPAPPSA